MTDRCDTAKPDVIRLDWGSSSCRAYLLGSQGAVLAAATLGFRIQWRRKRGTCKHYVYTFVDDRPIRSLKAKIRALTPGHHSRTWSTC